MRQSSAGQEDLSEGRLTRLDGSYSVSSVGRQLEILAVERHAVQVDRPVARLVVGHDLEPGKVPLVRPTHPSPVDLTSVLKGRALVDVLKVKADDEGLEGSVGDAMADEGVAEVGCSSTEAQDTLRRVEAVKVAG